MRGFGERGDELSESNATCKDPANVEHLDYDLAILEIFLICILVFLPPFCVFLVDNHVFVLENPQIFAVFPFDTIDLSSVSCFIETVLHELSNCRGHRINHDCEVWEVANEIEERSFLAQHGDLHESLPIVWIWEVQGLSCDLLKAVRFSFWKVFDSNNLFNPLAIFTLPAI